MDDAEGEVDDLDNFTLAQDIWWTSYQLQVYNDLVELAILCPTVERAAWGPHSESAIIHDARVLPAAQAPERGAEYLPNLLSAQAIPTTAFGRC